MYSLRHVTSQDKLYDHLDGDLFASFFPQDMLDRCFRPSRSSRKRRIRDFTDEMFFRQLVMNCLWARESQPSVWQNMAHPFSLLHPSDTIPVISGGAISYQRERFDHQNLHNVMKESCQPLSDPTRHPNAFYHGRRLVAIDGTKFNVPDTEANVEAFGRPSNQYGDGPYPQIQAVALMECGSRCVLDVGLGTHAQAEIHSLPSLLLRLEANMLVLTDSAFLSAWFWEQLQEIGAEALCALSSTVGRKVEKRLSDGSYLTTITPNHRKIYPGTRPIKIRVIEYVVTDERLGEAGKCYRLATTLLDEQTYPASELLTLYRERWEVETLFREIKSYLREQLKVLRSRTPEGVRQEVYALFLTHRTVGSLKLEAADQQRVDPDRVSFTEAKNHFKRAISDSLLADPACQEWLLTRLTRQIAMVPLLPERRLRMNRREIKLYYQKWHRKKREIAPLEAFDPGEAFLDFVKIWERPEGACLAGKDGGPQKAPKTQEVVA
jgi:Transposase DDE domain